MKSTEFRDSDQNVWDCKINLGKALLVDKSDFSMFSPTKIILSRFDRESVQTMLTDQAIMFAVIGVLVRDQSLQNLKIDPTSSDDEEDSFQREFVKRIDGSVIEPARQAFVEALQDFFPAARTVLSTFLKKIAEYQSKIDSRLSGDVSEMMDQKFDQELEKEVGRLRTSLNETSSP